MQPAGLEENGNSAKLRDDFRLPAIKSDDVALAMLDVHTCNKGCVLAESFGGPAQHVELFSVGQVVHIAGIHVYSIYQSGAMCGEQVLLKRLDGYSAISLKRQERRCNTLNFPPRLDLLDHCIDIE